MAPKKASAPTDEEVTRRADRYRAAAKALGLSLESLARRLDISLSTSNRYASGKSPVPTRVLELIDRWIAEAKPKRTAALIGAESRAPYKVTKKKRSA